MSFDQSQFSTPDASLFQTGYAYIPSACKNASGGPPCRLHVAFHGCEQSVEFVQQQFVENAGYNNVAEANNIVVLYPQCGKDELQSNPNGCFDWWGYTGADYVEQSAKQMTAVKKMIDYVSGKAVLA